MDSYDSEKRRIFQHFSRSTRFTYFCTAQISKIQKKSQFFFVKFLIFCIKNPGIFTKQLLFLRRILMFEKVRISYKNDTVVLLQPAMWPAVQLALLPRPSSAT